ncbi:WxcM-like domain-containing protein [Sphingobacterium griseoflavum]|uniref:Sugar epimerase n=1 Tax=Sphingobacterium griseoflavum TaxID=1474952 RepID=A0ABQ3HVK9_9SPHI|nr:WxcM-like domain-containing protein [Sphingobacterium griseoflavum]GHE38967.1 sugar epimerase [Sphingobacterium griseoflavum]
MVEILHGGKAQDHRGQIRFVNDFDMSNVKRFYIIKNTDTKLVRGWRGHRIEQRWFYVLSGSFTIDLVKIDDWDMASRDLPVDRKLLNSTEQQLLHVPDGYATAVQANEENSELLVFADYGVEHASFDDYTWSTTHFINRV